MPKRNKETALPVPANRHAAAVQDRLANRVRESRKAEAEYEATLDPRQFQE
jgi:hypothetical protein